MSPETGVIPPERARYAVDTKLRRQAPGKSRRRRSDVDCVSAWDAGDVVEVLLE